MHKNSSKVKKEIHSSIIYFALFIFSLSIIFTLSCNSDVNKKSGNNTEDSQVTENVPELPSYAMEGIKEALGFVPAPAYLLKGMRFSGIFIQEVPASTINPLITLTYTDEEQANALLLMYPVEWPLNVRSAPQGLVVPEDALKEITINEREAYLIKGSWPQEAWKEPSETGSVNIETEWDYDSMLIVQFAIDLSDNNTIGIQLGTTRSSSTGISENQLIKIAESVKLVD